MAEAVGKLVSPLSSEWTETLELVEHDIHHLPEFTRFISRHEEIGEAAAYIYKDPMGVLLMPMALRALPASLGDQATHFRDAITPREYGGPVVCCESKTRKEFLIRALGELRRTLAEHAVICVYIRLHPIFQLPYDILGEYGDLVSHQDSVSIDLAKPNSELWSSMRTGHRQDVRRLEKAGASCEIDSDWGSLAEFVAIRDQTMRRVGAEPRSLHDYDYFDNLRETLQDNVELWTARQGEQILAAAIISRTSGVAGYMHACTADTAVRLSPSKLLIWAAASRSQVRGDKVFHLGGSPARGDSLHRFKLGFSSAVHDVSSLRIVTSPEYYSKFHAIAAHSRMEAPNGYFPAYRSG